MQNKINKKLIVICLFLCILFFTNYASALSINGINGMNSSSVISQDIFSKNAGKSPSMDGFITYSQSDSMVATDSSEGISAFSSRQSRCLSTKSSFGFSTSKDIAQLARLFSTSRLSDRTYSQNSSSIITKYLHKKDGMK